MAVEIKLGFIVPSSNTVMEPIVTQMVADIDQDHEEVCITAHFSRVRVTQISNEASAASQFDLEHMLSAASLLADAKVNAIAWGGTSAGWLGIDTDVKLCETISQRFGIPAFTSTLSLIDTMKILGYHRVGLVTPYMDDMNQAIKKNFAKVGIEMVTGYEPLAITDNTKIANITESQLRDLILRVLEANEPLDTVITFCTNLKAAYYTATWEDDLPPHSAFRFSFLDSITMLVWNVMRVVDAVPNFDGIQKPHSTIPKRWGRLLGLAPHILDDLKYM